jgi:hypothetical protein
MDAYLYATVVRKARFIAQILDNECPSRVSEDLDEKVLTFAEIQAIAAGDDDVKEHIQTTTALSELKMLKREYEYEIAKFKREAEALPKMIENRKEILEKVKVDKEPAAKIGDIVISSPDGRLIHEKINEYLHHKINQAFKQEDNVVEVGTIGGFNVSVIAERKVTEGTTTYHYREPQARFIIKGENEYFCEASASETANNVTRLSNFFERTILSCAGSLVEEIEKMSVNLKQAQEQMNAPFEYEEKMAALTARLNELDGLLSDVTEQKEVVYDPEDEPVTETAAEKTSREAIYEGTDYNDYQAVPEEPDDDAPITQRRGR